MAHRYVKHPQYKGKSLTIRRGRQDKAVGDYEVLEGREWERFVAQGLLVPVVEEEVPPPKTPPTPVVPSPSPPPPAPPKEESPKEEPPKEEPPRVVKEEKASEGSVSKSPASKMSGLGGKRKKSKKPVADE